MTFKLKSLNNTCCRVLIKLIPSFGEDFPHHNTSYLSKVLSINKAYLEEIFDFLSDKDVVSFDGEDFFVSRDNVWKLQEYLNIQAMVILQRKIKDMG